MSLKKENHTRLNLNIPNDLLDKIEDYQFANKHKDRTLAIVDLLKKGLNKDVKEK